MELPLIPAARRWGRMSSRAKARLAIIIVGLMLATPEVSSQAAPGDTVRLTLAESRARAMRENPDLLALRLDTAIARGELRQASAFRFNPSVDFLGARGGNRAEAGISQELEVFGQRRARMQTSRASLAGARAGASDGARLTLGDVDREFFRVATADRRRRLANEVLSLNERLADIARRQLAEGGISRLDFNLAVVEVGRSRSRALSAQRDHEQSMLVLRRLVNLPAGVPIAAVLEGTHRRAAGDTMTARILAPHDSARQLSADSLIRVALARRPDIRQIDQQILEQQGMASIARREALPNLLLRGVGEYSESENRRVIRPGLGFTLPLFNRNQGSVAARTAAVRQARLRRAALVSRIKTEITSELQVYRSAAAEVDILETTVLIPARQNRSLVETAYREGKVGLPVVLLIRNQAIDAELDYWAAWLAEREAFANLEEATNQNVEDASRAPSAANQ